MKTKLGRFTDTGHYGPVRFNLSQRFGPTTKSLKFVFLPWIEIFVPQDVECRYQTLLVKYINGIVKSTVHSVAFIL